MRQLVEKVELHDKLNPKIWNEDGTLRKEVEEKLHEIIDQFILELDDSDIPIKVLDARLVGSNASFNYTENSDLDVHIIANFNDASCDTNVLSLLYNYFKKNFNDRYDISIHGVPVELYIEDVGSSAVSNGIFSLYKNEWIKFPEPIEIPDIDITQEYAKYESKYNNIINSGDAKEADNLIDELYLLRKDSLATEGEYGVGNLIFKQFRNDGYLDNLKQLLVDNTAKELSLEALSESFMQNYTLGENHFWHISTSPNLEKELRIGEQGFHIAESIRTIIDRIDVISSDIVYLYDVEPAQLSPLFIEYDNGNWNAGNISLLLLAYLNKELVKDIDDICGEDFDKNKIHLKNSDLDVISKNKDLLTKLYNNTAKHSEQKENEFIQISNILNMMGYDSIEYINAFEGKQTHSIILLNAPQQVKNIKMVKEADRKKGLFLLEAKEDKQKLIDFVGNDYTELFFDLKNRGRLKSPKNDIYYWLKRKPQELRDFLLDMNQTISNSEQRRREKSGATLLYNKDGWKIYKIDTYDSAKYYGKGTRWCISGNYPGSESRGEYYFEEYKDRGVEDYYFIISPDNHKWCYLDAHDDFEDSVLWDEEDSGIYNIYDGTIPNMPKDAMEILPNFDKHLVSDGPIIKIIEDIKKNNGTLIVDREINNFLDSAGGAEKRLLSGVVKKIKFLANVGNISITAFHHPYVEKIFIEDGISHINIGTFSDCKNLNYIRLPKTLKEIGYKAFGECKSLSKIHIPSSVEYIDAYAFIGCDNLTITCDCTEEYAERQFSNFWNVYKKGTLIPVIYNSQENSSPAKLNEAKEDKQKLIDHVGKEDAEYFFKLKDSGRLKPPYNDLYYWLKRKPSELNNYINDVGLTITKSQQRKLDKQGADLLYDEDGWKVYKINTYDSAKYYGKGTKWCISGNYAGQEEQGQYYFNEYLSKGVNGYYFIINPFGEKWCWLDVDAEFKDAPLWDEEDNGVTNTRSVYMPNNFPEGVIDVLPNAEEFFTFPEDIIEEHIANDVLEVDDEVVNILNSYDIYLQDFRFHTLYWNTEAHVKSIIGYIPQMEKLIILNGNDSDIVRGTFAGDTGLRVIYLPHTIEIIYMWAFDDATNLSDIYTDMDEDEFKRKYKGNIEEDLRDINIHYDTFQEDAVHKILYEKLNESAYFSSMEGMIEQAADRNPKPEDFFEQPWDALVDPNRFFKEITSNISQDAIKKVDKRINLNDKNNKFYNVLLKFLDAYKIPAYKRDSYTYDKLEPATMVEYSNGVRVPVDGKHTAKLCSRLGIKLPVRIIMKESLNESANTSKIMGIVDKIIENDLRLRISNNPPKFGKPFFILPDGTFLSGFYAHTNVEEILQDIGLSFYDDIDFQTPENYNYSTLLDLGCIRGRVDKVENYIQLPDDRPTSSQIDAIADAIFFAMTSGGSYIGKSGIFIEAPDTEQSRFYSFDDYEPEDIVEKIKRYYSSGILYETLGEEYLDDEEKFWDYRTKDISGKIAFDKTRSETPFGQRMIELANSGGTDSRDRKAFFYEMSPKEYFQACADGFGNSYQANINQVNDEIIPHLKEVLTKYKKMFPVGYLEYTNGNFGQEGRHRMFAAGEIFGWDTKQPVLIIYDGDRPTIPTHKKEYDPVKSEISDDELEDELDFDDLELLAGLDDFGFGSVIYDLKESIADDKTDSNGKTLSDSQIAYFKDSKVRDSSGRLLHVYHGTKDDFTVFKHGHMNRKDSGYLGDGFYFTDDMDSANSYSKWKRGNDYNSHTMEVYLNITNPLVLEHNQWATADLQDFLGLDLLTDDQKFDFKVNQEISNKLTEEVRKRGYDGIIYHNDFYDETIYVVYNSNQIKSVTNETPTASDDINESVLEEGVGQNQDNSSHT